MKKYFLIIPILLTIPAYASIMCAKNDSVVVILDPSITPDSQGFDSTGIWWANASYGHIRGIQASLSSNYNKSVGNYIEHLTDTNSEGITKTVVGGEENGNHCWCKLTHPVSSAWVYSGQRQGYINGGTCQGLCAYTFRQSYYEYFRGGLFGSISN